MKQNNGIKIIATTVVLAVGILGFVFYKIVDSFAPGSYPYAEQYEVEASEKALIRATNKFKAEHPEMVPPDWAELKDGQSASPDDHWYHVFFYYPKENQLLNTWIQSSGKTHSTFAFTSVNQGTTLGNWKRINKDFSWRMNRLKKKQFEQRILNEILESLK